MTDLLEIIFSSCLDLIATFSPEWRLSSSFSIIFALLAVIALVLGVIAMTQSQSQNVLVTASAACAIAALGSLLIGHLSSA